MAVLSRSMFVKFLKKFMMLFISLPRGQPERLSRKETERQKKTLLLINVLKG